MNAISATAPALHEGIRHHRDAATRLHAVAQGALELFDNVSTDGSPAANATYALLEMLIEKADQLSTGLDDLADLAAKDARQ